MNITILSRHGDDLGARAALPEDGGITMAGRGLAASLFNRDEAFCRERDRASRQADFAGLAMAMADGWRRHLPL
jgi:hypothetical protein